MAMDSVWGWEGRTKIEGDRLTTRPTVNRLTVVRKRKEFAGHPAPSSEGLEGAQLGRKRMHHAS